MYICWGVCACVHMLGCVCMYVTGMKTLQITLEQRCTYVYTVRVCMHVYAVGVCVQVCICCGVCVYVHMLWGVHVCIYCGSVCAHVYMLWGVCTCVCCGVVGMFAYVVEVCVHKCICCGSGWTCVYVVRLCVCMCILWVCVCMCVYVVGVGAHVYMLGGCACVYIVRVYVPVCILWGVCTCVYVVGGCVHVCDWHENSTDNFGAKVRCSWLCWGWRKVCAKMEQRPWVSARKSPERQADPWTSAQLQRKSHRATGHDPTWALRTRFRGGLKVGSPAKRLQNVSSQGQLWPDPP